jgi:hypothetical protein
MLAQPLPSKQEGLPSFLMRPSTLVQVQAFPLELALLL